MLSKQIKAVFCQTPGQLVHAELQAQWQCRTQRVPHGQTLWLQVRSGQVLRVREGRVSVAPPLGHAADVDARWAMSVEPALASLRCSNFVMHTADHPTWLCLSADGANDAVLELWHPLELTHHWRQRLVHGAAWLRKQIKGAQRVQRVRNAP